MTYPTIGREDIIGLFHQLMESDSFRVLHLAGEANMGKTHLVSKVFPELVKQNYQAQYAVLDLRGHMQNIPDILHAICGLLGSESLFPTYYRAYEDWANRPTLEVSGLKAFFSNVRLQGIREDDKSIRRIAPQLTAKFVEDLRSLTDQNYVLIFDTFDQAKESIRNWLVGTLVAHLATLNQIRIVVAGRSLPTPSGSYSNVCVSHRLQQVKNPEKFINFCRQLDISEEALTEQSIRDFAHVFDYTPGLFAGYVLPSYINRRGGYG